MSFFDQATIGIVLLYACATIGGFAGLLARRAVLRTTACVCAALAFGLHTMTFLMGSHAAQAGGLSYGAYLQLFAWFITLCALAAWWKWRAQAPLLFASPLVLALFMMSWRTLQVPMHLPAVSSGPFYALHIGTLFLSLGLLALACVAGILFVYLENKIKAKSPLGALWKDAPALSLLDKVNAVATMAGFPLYTVGMLAGFFWARIAFGISVSGDPKEVVSVMVWIVYSVLFHMRLVRGLRGRKPALMAISVFALSIFSFFVVNTFMQTYHSFIQRP